MDLPLVFVVDTPYYTSIMSMTYKQTRDMSAPRCRLAKVGKPANLGAEGHGKYGLQKSAQFGVGGVMVMGIAANPRRCRTWGGQCFIIYSGVYNSGAGEGGHFQDRLAAKFARF